jgi:cytochrome b
MGYTLGAVFLIRVIWGVVWPRRVRLKGLTGRLGTLDHTFEMIKSFDWQGLVKLLLAVSMVTLLVCTMPVVASGYLTYLNWLGKWTKEIHETLGNFMIVAVVCHVGAVTLLSMGKTDR